MDLMARAPWREAVTYRETWPHEYVVIQKDGQQELLTVFCQRILRGEGVEGRFFHQSRQYLFLGDYKYWTMTECADIDPETYDGVLNRALLFKDRRDFIIRRGDTAKRKENALMATQELGEIKEVRIRDLWPREAGDFTPWLAEHLASLGNALALDLELVEQEASVGSFSLDILAKETSDGEMVAIENQLEVTDHRHLGQSITYAAEHQAAYVIWVASHFRAEHRAAIDYLNQLAPERVWFFGVEVHAIKIGDSLPAVDFRPVAAPNKWHGGRTGVAVASPPPHVLRNQEFFQPLVKTLEEAGFSDPVYEQESRQLWFPYGHDYVWYVLGLEDGEAWACLWLVGGDEFNARAYDALQFMQDEIDAELGIDPDWQKGDDDSAPSVTVSIEGCMGDPPEKQDETRAWMLETLTKLRDVLNPRLKKVLADLE